MQANTAETHKYYQELGNGYRISKQRTRERTLFTAWYQGAAIHYGDIATCRTAIADHQQAPGVRMPGLQGNGA